MSTPTTPRGGKRSVAGVQPKRRSMGGKAGSSRSMGSNSMGSPIATRHSVTLPDDWEQTCVYVYEKPKHGGKIKPVEKRRQGVWEDGNSSTVSPTELWIFPNGNEPGHLEGSKHIHGAWGLKPGVEDMDTCQPEEMWFFSPNSKLPRYFTKRGVWTYPLVKRDITHLAPKEAGFLHVADSVKTHKLDVAGQWRMLYKRDSESEIKGPGMKKKSAAPKPKPLKITVLTPNGEKIPLSVLPTDSIAIVKSKVEDKEGTPKEEQRLLWDGKELDNKPSLADYGISDGSTLELEGMKLYVKHWDGRKFELDVDPNDTIDDVKSKVESQEGIPKKHQRLTFTGKPLNKDSITLKSYNIPHKSILELEAMEIVVKTPQGKTISLVVSPTDTVKDVKKKVLKYEGIPIDEQQLLFEGEELDNTATLDECGIEHGSTLDLEGMQIYVQDWKGNTFELEVDPTETVDSVKSKILDQQGIPRDQQRLTCGGKPLGKDTKTLRDYKVKNKSTLVLEPMKISVKTPQGKVVELLVDPNDTLDDIKTMVEAKEAIPKEEQRLTHKGKHLGDGTSLAENKIKHGSTLDMESMQIYVKDPKGKKFSLTVDPKDTIREIKEKIEDQEGIPQDEQRLAFEDEFLDDDDKMLRDYNIKHKTTLDLEPMQIHVQTPQGKTVTLDVDPNDSVLDVKNQIADCAGIPVSEQRLELNGKPMHDDNSKLRDNGVQHGDSVDMEGMQIFIKDEDGTQFPVDVDPSDRLVDVKAKIQDREEIPVDQQRLAYLGLPLKDDNKTLRAYKIPHKAIIDLEPMQIIITTPEGKKITLNVNPNDTIQDVKDQVDGQECILPEDQRLVFKGKELSDEPTLKDCGIKHGSSLDLEGMQIFIKDAKNKVITLDVRPSDTLASVKDQIEKEKGIPAENQYILFQKELLKDDDQTLRDYGIEHQSTLNLDRMKIYVDTPAGKGLIDVDPTTTVDEIKKKIHQKFGMHPDHQLVEFDGKKLADPSTVADNGIEYKDTLDVDQELVSPKPKKGSLSIPTTPSGPEYTVKVGPWQNPFTYSPGPKIKREGTRARKGYKTVSDFYSTAVNTDVEKNEWTTAEVTDGEE